MGAIVHLWDRLTNVMSGMGTSADKRAGLFYNFIPLTGPEAEAGYRSSWLVRKIVDVPPFDMTREWRDWQANGPDIEKLEAEERRLQLKMRCQRALVLARLYGGSALILGTNDADPMQPLRPDAIQQGGLKFVHVVSRWHLTHGAERLDPADPWFGQPEYFAFNSAAGSSVKMHPSRVVTFVGQRAPEGGFYSNGQSWFWGDPIMQSVGDAVKNADLAQSGFAALIDRSAVDVYKFKDLMSVVGTPEGEQNIKKRVAWTTQAKSTHRAALIDAQDDLVTMQVTWAGIPAVMDSFLLVVAGAADIPMTRLLGQSPKGLQSTGDGEERDYHSMLKARQGELLRPALERIDELLIRSALGSYPSDVYWEFAPFDQPDQAAAATVEKTFAETVQAYATSGVVPDTALSAMAKNRIIESGQWPGSETAFEEAEAAGDDPTQQDPAQLLTHEQKVLMLTKQGTVTADQSIALLNDASPRSLYVSRKLLNADALIAWAKEQGFETTVPADQMYVTICFSREPIDWMTVGQAWDEDQDGKLRVPPGGARMLDRFGNMKDAIVLLFNSSSLSWRHEDFKAKGASFDFDQYQPHITLTYDAPADLDLSKVEPYRGELIFGPEVFEEVNDDWKQTVEEA